MFVCLFFILFILIRRLHNSVQSFVVAIVVQYYVMHSAFFIFVLDGFIFYSAYLKDFFNKEDNKIDSADRAIKQSCETIRNNASWLKRDQESLKEFLKGQ